MTITSPSKSDGVAAHEGVLACQIIGDAVNHALARKFSMQQPALNRFKRSPRTARLSHLKADHRSGMRRRLIEGGPDALLDHELLEMALLLALPARDTRVMAQELVARFGGFAGVIAAPPAELLHVSGLGNAGLAALKSVHAAALRLTRVEVRTEPLLNSWERLLKYLTAALARERVEQFHVLFMDVKNRLISDEIMGRGTVNHVTVYTREVLKRGIQLQATALILVHNHPSGDPTPSRADIELTADIKAACQIIGILLHDHLIVAGGRHFSFRHEGLL